MTLALSDVPDWISIPASLDGVSSRDELHTPFGLYVLLHELTAGSRALMGGNCLLVAFAETGAPGGGGGLRPLVHSEPVLRLGRRWALASDTTDEKGRPRPLEVRLDLLRLTYIELNQKPVAHTERTAVTTYLARNRGNVTEYRKVVAQSLAAEVDKARARGVVAVMLS